MNSERPISRREFLRISRNMSLQAAAAGATLTVVGSVLYYESQRQDEDLKGHLVDGERYKLFITDSIGDIDQIPLRSSPTRSEKSIIGWTKPGFGFSAQKEYGVVYASYPESLGKFEADGRFYGSWYRGVGLPVFEKKGELLVPVLSENGQQIKSGTVHVAGNFLRLPREGEMSDNLSDAR